MHQLCNSLLKKLLYWNFKRLRIIIYFIHKATVIASENDVIPKAHQFLLKDKCMFMALKKIRCAIDTFTLTENLYKKFICLRVITNCWNYPFKWRSQEWRISRNGLQRVVLIFVFKKLGFWCLKKDVDYLGFFFHRSFHCML